MRDVCALHGRFNIYDKGGRGSTRNARTPTGRGREPEQSIPPPRRLGGGKLNKTVVSSASSSCRTPPTRRVVRNLPAAFAGATFHPPVASARAVPNLQDDPKESRIARVTVLALARVAWGAGGLSVRDPDECTLLVAELVLAGEA